jgi:hypothetical protein
VGERERDVDAVRGDAPPAVGQVPQQHVQPRLGVTDVDDGEVERERARALHGARQQLAHDGRPLGDGGGEAVVEHRDGRALDRRPRDAATRWSRSLVAGPGAQEVARADQLGTFAAVEVQRADHEALEDEQPEAPAQVVARSGRLPRPGLDPQLRHDGAAAEQVRRRGSRPASRSGSSSKTRTRSVRGHSVLSPKGEERSSGSMLLVSVRAASTVASVGSAGFRQEASACPTMVLSGRPGVCGGRRPSTAPGTLIRGGRDPSR